MKHKLLGAVILLASLVLMVPSVSAAPDLSRNHGFYDEITYLMDKDIVNGYPDGTVRPDRDVSRAEAAIMIGRLHGFSGEKQETKYSDVPRSHGASGYIAEATEAGFISGYPDGTYKPDDTITRGDMAIILKEVFSLGMRMDEEFKDVSSNMKAYGPIENILAASITIGYSNETFQPYADVTRGQFSAFLARGMEPKFQNEATIPNSYLRDKTKTYVMQGQGDTLTYVYEKHSINEGVPPEFMWVLTSESGNLNTATVERESFTEYKLGFPYSETYVNLAYPVVEGNTFAVGFFGAEEPETRTITGVDMTVETPYRTFTNATEVTGVDGTKYYFAEGHGTIKTIGPSGAVVSELAEVR